MDLQSRKQCMLEDSTALSSCSSDSQVILNRSPQSPQWSPTLTDRTSVESTELNETPLEIKLTDCQELTTEFINSPVTVTSTVLVNLVTHNQALLRIHCNSAELWGTDCRGEPQASKADLASICLLALAARNCSDPDTKTHFTPWGTHPAHEENSHIHAILTSFLLCFLLF